jgi:hypothetical protein
MSDIDTILRNLRRLAQRSEAAIAEGLGAGARIVEGDAQQTEAYAGMSGATRASTIAYVATPTDSGESEVQGAYNAAAGLLQNFTGHEGRPELVSVPGPGASEAWVVLTTPTDYAIKLETEFAGEKAFIADTMHQNAPQVQAAVVAALRKVWG